MTTLDDPFAPSVDYLAWLAKKAEEAAMPEPDRTPAKQRVLPVPPKKTPPDPRAKLRATANLPFWVAPPLREVRGEEAPKGYVHRLRETEHDDDH